MKNILFIFFAISIVIFTSCGAMFREISCRDFTLKGEHYWFPTIQGDSVFFVNSALRRKIFIVTENEIQHRTRYISDSGCGCLDNSFMKLQSTDNVDTIFFHNQARYVEGQDGNYSEDILIRISSEFSAFLETNRTKLNTYIIGNITINDVERFDDKEAINPLDIKILYRAKNLGIVRMELVNGEIWINENLTKLGLLTKESFDYSENVCE